MSRELASELPRSIADNVAATEPPNLAVQLITIDNAGFPHTSLLTYYELVLKEGELHAAVSATSRSAGFLRSRGLAELVFIAPEEIFYLKVQASPVAKLGSLSIFKLIVDSVLADSPPPEEQGTELTSGITFKMTELSRSARSTLKQQISEVIGSP